MFTFATQHQFTFLILLAALLSLTACAARYTVHPGALNKVDSAAFDVLLVAETTIDEARRLPLDTKDAKPALNALIASYNVARESWLTYRGAIATNTTPQAYLDRLNQNLSDLEKAIRAFEEGQ